MAPHVPHRGSVLPVNGARQLTLNALPAIIVVTAFYASGSAGRKALILAGLLALAVAAAISSVLQWLWKSF